MAVAAAAAGRYRRAAVFAGGLAVSLGAGWLPLRPAVAPATPTSYAIPAEPYATRSIARGAALYAENCALCHGASGRGDGPAAAGMRVRPADLTAPHLFAHTPGDLMRKEFLRGASADVHAVFDSDGTSAVENVETLIARILAEQRPDMVYTCGSNRLLTLLQKLNAAGEVALEQQMACAMGVCLSCVRLFNENGEKVFRRVCCEGPVFPLGAVAGEVQFG